MQKVDTKLLFNIVSKIMGISSLIYSIYNIIENWKLMRSFDRTLSFIQIVTSIMMIINVYVQFASIISLILTIYGFLFI